MTDLTHADRLADRAHKSMMAAQELIDAGFCTKAAQKSAIDHLNRAYDQTREIVHNLAIDNARNAVPGWNDGSEASWGEYHAALDAYELPYGLHQVRPAHIERAAGLAAGSAQIIAELVDTRTLAKDTPIVPLVRDETKARIETVRKSIIEQMAQRRAQYVEALDMARQFNGLPVHVNAHWVRHEQGTVYLRHYFYLRGKLTPLQVLLAAADTYARETELNEAAR